MHIALPHGSGTRRRLAFTLVAAGFLMMVFATHVFVTITRTRVKVVDKPIVAQSVAVTASTAGFANADALQPPFALIARLHPGSSGGTFTVLADESRVCERQVMGLDTQRIDCVVTSSWRRGMEHSIRIIGPSGGWTLHSLELATHYGSTSYLYVLPGKSRRYDSPAPLTVILVGLAIGVLLVCPSIEHSLPSGLRLLHRITSAAIVVVLAAIVCSQWVSDYRVVISPAAYVTVLTILFAPRIWPLAARFAGDREAWNWIVWAKAAAVGIVVVFAYAAIVDARLADEYRGNYSGFLNVDRRAFDKNPLLRDRADVRETLRLRPSGYDGEFFYFAAFDPFLLAFKDDPRRYRDVVDTPPYRYSRIGFTLLTRLVAGDRWDQYPATMIHLILGGFFVGAVALSLLAHTRGLPPAYGALVACIPGFWTSVQTGLPEPIAAASLLAGVLCLSRRAYVLAFGLFALSLLVRETGLIAIGCIAATAFGSGDRKPAVVAVGAVAVLTLWRVYLAWRLFPDWGLDGLLFHPPGLSWPLQGLVELWRVIARGEYYPAVPLIAVSAAAFSVLLLGGVLLAAALCIASPSTASVSALCYGMLAVCLNYEYVWLSIINGQRTTYELFVMLAIATVGFRSYSRPIQVALTTFWIASAAYILFGNYDAPAIRNALHVPL